MQFIYSEPQTDFERLIGGHYYINAFGPIEPGDGQKFRRFLENASPPARTMIYIDSTGGDVEAAIEIGNLIREGWHSTSVGKYHMMPRSVDEPFVSRELKVGRCLSAATLVFLGGKLRYLPQEALFGVHQFSFKNPLPDSLNLSQKLSAKIASYIHAMGVSIQFLELSSSTSSDDISYVEPQRLRELNIVTDHETDPVWTVQARNKMVYVRGERDSMFGHHKIILAYIKGEGFHCWAVIEAQGREEELLSFGLVEIALNGDDEELLIDISERAVRIVSGIYVNVFSPITLNEARLIAFSKSYGLRIRMTSEAGMFLGIAPVRTASGSEQLEAFFECFSDQLLSP